jgi:hypothetical protein
MTSVGEASAPLRFSWLHIELITHQRSRVEGESPVISDGKGIAIWAACSGANGAFRQSRRAGRSGQPTQSTNRPKWADDQDMIRNGQVEVNTRLRSAAERRPDCPCLLGAVHTRRRCCLGGIVAAS